MSVTKNGNPQSLNSIRNGKHVARLNLGSLPKPLAQTGRVASMYRRGLEKAVLEAKGMVSLHDAHLIDAATQHQLHMGINRWLLRDRLEKMSIHDIRECTKAIALAADKRNRVISQLNIDASNPSIATLLYGSTDDDSTPIIDVSPHNATTESGEA